MIIKRQKQFGIIGKIVEWGQKYEKWKNPNYKTPQEIEDERRKAREQERSNKQSEILNKLFALSKYHKIAYNIEKEADKYLPNWGDGDEYPSFWVRKSDSGSENFGNICLGYQSEEEYHWNGKYWEEISNPSKPRKVNNLKQDILKNLKDYRKSYAKIDYLDKEKVNSVLNYLDLLISIITRSSL